MGANLGPLGYLQTHGPHADATTALMWGLIWLSLLVVVLITALVVWAVVRRRGGTADQGLAVASETGGVGFISIGMALTLAALLATLVWTVKVLAETNSPAQPVALTIEVTGEQWWWRVVYAPDDAANRFATANELHIPVGRPVLVTLKGADVIHSFWVPALAGKTDTIPGRTNLTWLQASQPGTYQGQCTEYCGTQHAHMAFAVAAQSPAEFERWRTAQLQPAGRFGEAAPGMAIFDARCGRCHAVRGSPAGGHAGPDLTHLMSRATLASGALPNTTNALMGWIANPDAVKPGTKMPPTYLSGPELGQLRAYLETLR